MEEADERGPRKNAERPETAPSSATCHFSSPHSSLIKVPRKSKGCGDDARPAHSPTPTASRPPRRAAGERAPRCLRPTGNEFGFWGEFRYGQRKGSGRAPARGKNPKRRSYYPAPDTHIHTQRRCLLTLPDSSALTFTSQ